MTLGHRFNTLKKKLLKKLDNIVGKRSTSKEIQDMLEDLSDEQYNELIGGKEDSFASYDEEQAYLGLQIAQKQYAVIYDALYNDFFFDGYEQYGAFLKQELPDAFSE